MLCKNHKTQKGQSLVETALMLPVILLLLLGIIDFGLLFNNYMVVSNASREGARTAAIGSTDAQITAAAGNAAASLDPAKLTITITPDEATGRASGTPVTVTVKYQYSMITPVIAAVIPGPFDLKTSTTMRCE
ncbi:MAG TPA: TadE/TadG family type IV pilus assembly protein [Clostridia bacterium]|nr:TadE/TadG family type IV pilus assembly protein [Clostridia bacterium]